MARHASTGIHITIAKDGRKYRYRYATGSTKIDHEALTLFPLISIIDTFKQIRESQITHYLALSYSMGLSILDWLQQGGPHHPKHTERWSHPVATCLVHYFVVIAISVSVHDLLRRYYHNHPYHQAEQCKVDAGLQQRRTRVSAWLVVYSAWILIWRIVFRKEPASKEEVGVEMATPKAVLLYEYCWLCNVTLVVSAIALLTGRPILATAYAVVVGIDQLLWYVDLLSYCYSGKFVVGVAKYICWPGNSDWTSRITCTHHLWTIPLLLYGSGGTKLHVLAYPLSLVCMTANVLLSRFMTPSHVAITTVGYNFKSTTGTKYLNINLSHALWKDIKFGFLQINYDDPPAPLYLFRLLWRWHGFNTIVFGLLYALCRLAAGGNSAVSGC